MAVPKSVEVWKVWKECGKFPQKVVELYWGMGELAQGEGAVEWALYSKEVLIKNTEVAEDYRLYFLILL